MLLVSCQTSMTENIKTQTDSVVSANNGTIEELVIDTILERNNPKNLDLNNHQLFIDTTRNSIFYQEILNWKPNDFDSSGVNYYLSEISRDYKLKPLNIENFPKIWITLEKLNNKFVVYYSCDGITPRFEIADKSLNFYAVEPDVDALSKVVENSKDRIKIELRTIEQKSQSKKALLTIRKTKYRDVYLLSIQYDTWEMQKIVTPVEKIANFDMVVNYCNKVKILEYNRFDETNYKEY
ncbi:MAG TPA: hypothetical protein DDX39_05820 [Bacteroidales bacterium]|nr:hypothetical protein [Bacteroidales bacterium]